MNTKPNRDITAEEPTTSTEWEKEIEDIIFEFYMSAGVYSKVSKKAMSGIKGVFNKLLTTRTNELLGAMKMEKKQLHSVGGGDIGGYIDVPDDAYNRRVEIYNHAIDEFNEKLATLREKYSV